MPNNVVYALLPQCNSIVWFPKIFTNLTFIDFSPLILHHYLDFYLILFGDLIFVQTSFINAHFPLPFHSLKHHIHFHFQRIFFGFNFHKKMPTNEDIQKYCKHLLTR
jgi:hypothetical protein